MSDTRLNERIEQRIDGEHKIIRSLDYEGNMFVRGDIESDGDVIIKDASGNPISLKELAGGGGKTGVGFIDTAHPETLTSSGTAEKDGWLKVTFSNTAASTYQRVSLNIDSIAMFIGKLLPGNVDDSDVVVFSCPIKEGQTYYVSTGPFSSSVTLYPMIYNED